MKMHPKPMIRHTQHVVDVETSLSFVTAGDYAPKSAAGIPYTHHIVFTFDDGKTQRLCMTKAEAARLGKWLMREVEE